MCTLLCWGGGGSLWLVYVRRGLNTVLSVAIEVLTVQITQYVVDVFIRLRYSCRCVTFLFIGPESFLHQRECKVGRNLKYKTTEHTVFVLRASCSRGQSKRRVDSTWNAEAGIFKIEIPEKIWREGTSCTRRGKKGMPFNNYTHCHTVELANVPDSPLVRHHH